MQVLVVEDSTEKANAVSEIALSVGLGPDQIVVVPDVAGAKRELASLEYDALVLDIQIPIRYGETAKPDGGIRLLDELNSSRTLHRPHYVLGITQYADSFTAASPAFFRSLAGILHVDPSSKAWEVELRSFLLQVQAAVRTAGAGGSRQVDMLVICALNDPELAGLIRCAPEFTPIDNPNGGMIAYEAILQTQRGSKRILAACALEMGMAAAAALSAKLIERHHPRYVAISGIAGGVEGEVQIGDVVVADMVWDYSAGKLSTRQDGQSRFEPEPRVIPLDAFTKRQMIMFMSDPQVARSIQLGWTEALPADKLTVHLGPMFTGSVVVANQARVEELTFTHRKLKSIEMEAYAVFCAAKYADAPQPVAIAIKAISDLANHGKNDLWRRYAAHTSSSYLMEWAKRYL